MVVLWPRMEYEFDAPVLREPVMTVGQMGAALLPNQLFFSSPGSC